MQFTINGFRQLFPDKIFSLTAVKFPDISRFSRQVVTLYIKCDRLTLCIGELLLVQYGIRAINMDMKASRLKLT